VFGGEEELIVKGYSNGTFQTDADDSKSQSGFVFYLNGGAVSWKSSKQDTVADSTMEAEHIAASEPVKEVVWIRNFVFELVVVPSLSNPMDLYCNNSGAIAHAKEPRAHKRAKHVLRCYHLIRQIIGQSDVKVCKVHMDHNIADPLTKSLPQPKHEAHMRSMGIRYLHD
jgi:hypothetical protein